MVRRIPGLLIAILLSLSLWPAPAALAAGPVSKQWDKTFGGPSWDEAFAVECCSDQGYIVAGYTHSYGAGWSDVWLIKTGSDGSEQWNMTFGGPDQDEGHSVRQTSDDGYVIAGWTRSFGAGEADAWLIKTGSDGSEQWSTTFGGPDADFGRSVQQTTDGGYVVAGWTHSSGSGEADAWLIKTGSDGSEQWSTTFGGPEADFGRSVQQTADGGYIFAGDTSSYGAGEADVWLIKTDSDGSEQWSTTFGGPEADFGRSVRQTSDGGYIVVGDTHSAGSGSADVWLIKTDSDGIEQWSITFGGPETDFGQAVEEAADGGYVLAGNTYSYSAGRIDIWLIKVADGAGMPAAYQWLGVAAMIGVLAIGAILLSRRRSVAGRKGGDGEGELSGPGRS